MSAAGTGEHLRLVWPPAAMAEPPPAFDEGDLGPARRDGAAGPLGLYVAGALMDGRPLFAVLADRFVQERIDEQPYLLDELACDTLVGATLSKCTSLAPSAAPGRGLPLAV